MIDEILLVETFGHPLVLGIFVIMFFIALTVALRLGLEGGTIVLIPAFMWVFYNIPAFSPFKIVFAVGLGIVVGLLFLKIVRR